MATKAHFIVVAVDALEGDSGAAVRLPIVRDVATGRIFRIGDASGETPVLRDGGFHPDNLDALLRSGECLAVPGAPAYQRNSVVLVLTQRFVAATKLGASDFGATEHIADAAGVVVRYLPLAEYRRLRDERVSRVLSNMRATLRAVFAIDVPDSRKVESALGTLAQLRYLVELDSSKMKELCRLDVAFRLRARPKTVKVALNHGSKLTSLTEADLQNAVLTEELPPAVQIKFEGVPATPTPDVRGSSPPREPLRAQLRRLFSVLREEWSPGPSNVRPPRAVDSAHQRYASSPNATFMRLAFLFVNWVFSAPAAGFVVANIPSPELPVVGAVLIYVMGLFGVTTFSLIQYWRQLTGVEDPVSRDWNRRLIAFLIFGTQTSVIFDFFGGDVERRNDAGLVLLSLFVISLMLLEISLVVQRARPVTARFMRVFVYLTQSWLPFIPIVPLVGGVGALVWTRIFVDRQGLYALLFGGGLVYSVGAFWYLLVGRRDSSGPSGRWYYTVFLGWIAHFWFVVATLRSATSAESWPIDMWRVGFVAFLAFAIGFGILTDRWITRRQGFSRLAELLSSLFLADAGAQRPSKSDMTTLVGA